MNSINDLSFITSDRLEDNSKLNIWSMIGDTILHSCFPKLRSFSLCNTKNSKLNFCWCSSSPGIIIGSKHESLNLILFFVIDVGFLTKYPVSNIKRSKTVRTSRQYAAGFLKCTIILVTQFWCDVPTCKKWWGVRSLFPKSTELRKMVDTYAWIWGVFLSFD